MLKVEIYAYCIDVTRVYLVKIFKVLGAGSWNNKLLGTMVMIVVNNINESIFFMKIYKVVKKNVNYNNRIIIKNNNNNNKYYSTRVELIENYYNELRNRMQKIDKINKENKYNFEKALIEKEKHPITVEKGREIDKERVEVMFVSETTKGKQIKEGNGELVDVKKLNEGKFIPLIVYKEDIINDKLFDEDKRFRYSEEEENNKVEVINSSKDFKEFKMYNNEKGEIIEYSGEKWDKFESFNNFLNKFKD